MGDLFFLCASSFGPIYLHELALQVFYQGVGASALFVALLSYAVVKMGSQRFSMIVICVPILSLMFGRLIVGDGITWMKCVAITLISVGILYGAFFKARV